MHVQASGWTALFIASKEGNVKIVQLLITRGASVDLKDKVISIVHMKSMRGRRRVLNSVSLR